MPYGILFSSVSSSARTLLIWIYRVDEKLIRFQLIWIYVVFKMSCHLEKYMLIVCLLGQIWHCINILPYLFDCLL